MPSQSQPAFEAELRAYILQELAAGQPRLSADTPLFESVLDSTSVLALVSHLEQCYQIEIHDREVVPANFSTLRQLSAYLARKCGQACAPLAASG